MGAAAAGIVELLKVGGVYAGLAIALMWAAFERWQNVKTKDKLIEIAVAQIGAMTELKGAILAQDKVMTMVLTKL